MGADRKHPMFQCCGAVVPKGWAGGHICAKRSGEARRASRENATLGEQREEARDAATLARVGSTPTPAATPARRRDGSATEDALYAALLAAGFMDIDSMPPPVDYPVPTIHWFLRDYPYGRAIGRRWRADLGFPWARVLVEIDGRAHNIEARRKGDIEKKRAAEEMGWRIVTLHQSEVRDGSAVGIVERAVNKGGVE